MSNTNIFKQSLKQIAEFQSSETCNSQRIRMFSFPTSTSVVRCRTAAFTPSNCCRSLHIAIWVTFGACCSLTVFCFARRACVVRQNFNSGILRITNPFCSLSKIKRVILVILISYHCNIPPPNIV